MARQRQKRKKQKNNTQILAMGLVGAGLLVIGVMAFLLWPKPDVSAGVSSQYSTVPAQVDFQAPDLTLTDLNGNPVSLADYRDQVVLVNNWATWCPPCKAEMPTLQAFYEAHRNQGLVVVAIEAGEPVSDVADFVRNYGLTFPVWPDPTQLASTVFNNDALPNSYVIDRSGRVRLAWTGAISKDMLEKHVTPLLEE